MSSVLLPVAFVGLAAVAAPEARGAAEASWAARWVAQRTAERAEALGAHLVDAARESVGIAKRPPLALYAEPTPHRLADWSAPPVTPRPDPAHLAITFAPRPALIDLPPPQA